MENSYQLSRIHNYISGLMSKEEMFQLEKEALADPFLQDAIDGYRLEHGVHVKQLSLLQQRLHKRIETTKATRNTQYYTWQRLAIGSAAGVIFVVLVALIYFKNFSTLTVRTTEVELKNPVDVMSVAPILAGGDASPLLGWNNFEQYLDQNYSLATLGGSVTVSFEVGPKGELINFKFEDEANAQLINEARRLLLGGPKWQGEKGKMVIIFPQEKKRSSQVIKPTHCFGLESKS